MLTKQGRLELILKEPATIDPGLATHTQEATIAEALFEPLVHAIGNGAVQSAAAESWNVSADGKVYEFRLRNDRRWTTGEEVVAEDFTWAWKRNLDPEFGAPLNDLFFPISGAENFARTGKDPNQLGMMAAERNLITVRLTRQSPSFPTRTATSAFAPLPRGEIESQGAYWTMPGRMRGNGPYKLVQWDKGRGMSLHPNTHYTGPPPSFSDVVIRFSDSQTDTTTAFRKGGAHVAEISPTAYATVNATKDLRLYERTGSWFIVLNTRKPPWHSPAVRLALSLALDRKQLIANAFDQAALPSNRLVPSTVLSNQNQESPDITAAHTLMANAGFTGQNRPPPFRLTYLQTEQGDRIAYELARQWEETLGLKVEADARDWGAFRSFTAEPDEFDAYQADWYSTYRHPQSWYDEIWHSDVDRFSSGWTNEAFDNLLETAASESAVRRYDAYVAADDILNSETPAIPIGNFASAFLVKPGVTGFAINPVSGAIDLTKIKINAQK
jgi:oligopeptide transport system substrate-binding protein